MKSQRVEQIQSPIAHDEARQALEGILASKYFANAHKKKMFLRLICNFYFEGRAHELNEHLLGYDVFGRDSSYNPSADPIVRVFAHEIRKKLDAYYANEGASDTIRLEIPAGSYQPVFARRASQPVAVSYESSVARQPADSKAGRRKFSLGKLAVGLAFLSLAIAAVGLTLLNKQLRHQFSEVEASKNASIHATAWASFLSDNNPPLVMLSNPPAFRFANPSDPQTPTKESVPLSAETVEALKEKFVTNPEILIRESAGPSAEDTEPSNEKVAIARGQTPRLLVSTNVYTGVGEAIALHYLTDFFRKFGSGISLKQSRTLSAEDLKNHNVIVLGGVWVNEWSSKLTRSEDFVFSRKATIENRNPHPGEELRYIPQFDKQTGNLAVDYALITVKPNISAVRDVMLLAGVYSEGTEAAGEFITNQNYLEQLDQHLAQSGSPRYFQALLKIGVENGIPTTISILAIHPLRLISD